MFICQTPHEFCSGGISATSHGLETARIKVHRTGQDANRCYINYLVTRQGYKRTPFSSRTLHKDGQPALILPKRRKPDLRTGKPAKDGKSGSRLQPKSRGGKGGVIVG